MMSKFTLTIFSILVALCYSFTIFNPSFNAHEQTRVDVAGLGFTNQTGTGVDSTMQQKIVDSIKKGFLYHRDNITGHAEYVRRQLVRSYDKFWTVIIFAENTTGSYSFYSYNNTYVIWSKVISQKPRWTYVIFAVASNYGDSKFDGPPAQGSGLAAANITIIKNVIKGLESKYGCYAIAAQISKSLTAYDNQRWNTICSFKNNTVSAQAEVYKDEYYVPSNEDKFQYFYVVYSIGQ